ncbi:MAG: quinoprotein dehydrogenase-associated SoxYZ-like carrier [Hyphomicrobiales bacterium]|nr:quinoprotein dehydrogenase-associated SoxYZ-like carrier [Hyphomicrobiales bacterium]
MRRMTGLWLLAAAALVSPAAAQSDKTWESFRADVFGSRPIADGTNVITLQAPVRAEDAAITPIDVAPAPGAKPIKALTLIIDENPAPVVASFSFGPGAMNAAISTRVRVDSYSYVRAVAELEDGSLHMVKKFVKASGGCSAPAGKDHDKAIAEMGKMKLRQFTPKDGAREAQIMIRHPNYSGLQMDQLTRNYTPAHFVRDIEIKRGDELIFRMEGGISLSEDPNIRFLFKPGAGDIKVTAKDTESNVWTQSWPVEAQGS